jgi:hypothetical protein
LGQEHLHLRVRLPKFLVLHFQLDLMDLQFVNEPRGVIRRALIPVFQLLTLPLLAQPFFSAAAQLGGIRRLVRFLFHGLAIFVAAGFPACRIIRLRSAL